MLNGGTHGIDTGLTNSQILFIKIKSENVVKSMLDIEFNVNRNDSVD